MDTDGAGYIIDIFIEKNAEVYQLGVKNVDVLIVDNLGRKIEPTNTTKTTAD